MPDVVTLVTGTRKGIGRALAEHYVRAGHCVVGCSRTEVDWTLEGYAHYRADVADERAVKELFTEIRRKINNQLLAQARTLWVPIDTRTGKPTRVSAQVRSQFSV